MILKLVRLFYKTWIFEIGYKQKPSPLLAGAVCVHQRWFVVVDY